MRWILDEVNLTAKVIDNQGTIKWTVSDTVDSKTLVDAIKNNHLAIGHDVGTNIAVLVEVLSGIFVDQIMAGSLKFEVSSYEER